MFVDFAHEATMPVDVVKVRLQYAGADGNKLYNGITDCIVKTAKVVHVRVGWSARTC